MAENAEKVLSAEPAPPKWLRVLGAYRQWVLFAAGLLLFAGVISLVFWLQDDDWRPVYAGLSEKDAAAVVQALQQERIPYRVKEGAVLVPADQVHIARIRLAGRGVAPEGGVGFELFDRANEFGLSEFTRRINLQRALQGELARTIEVIPQVASARVHIVLPKRSPFAGEERRASASVMLRLIGDLPKRAVVAIQNLVAASVPDLAPEDVVVVDASGHLLSQPKGEAQAEVATIDERQAALERRIERRLTTMLEQIVGPGQAVARVSVEMDRAYLEAHERHVNPDEVLARHERARNETRTRSEAQPIGVPGVASNTPG
ncbi:MAG: flagellar M-ring protein FliF, partial [Zetaproteobacteria bacterium]